MRVSELIEQSVSSATGDQRNRAASSAGAASWTVARVEALFKLPFNDLLFRAQTVHREHFDPNSLQVSTLLSIKTGGCPEDCQYCPQAARHDTGVENEPLMSLEEVVTAAKAATVLLTADNRIETGTSSSYESRTADEVQARDYVQGFRSLQQSVGIGYEYALGRNKSVGASYRHGLTDITVNSFFGNAVNRNSMLSFYFKLKLIVYENVIC